MNITLEFVWMAFEMSMAVIQKITRQRNNQVNKYLCERICVLKNPLPSEQDSTVDLH